MDCPCEGTTMEAALYFYASHLPWLFGYFSLFVLYVKHCPNFTKQAVNF